MTLPREQTAEEDAVTLAPGERRRVTARVPGPVDVTFRVRRRDGSHAVGVKIRSFQRRRTRDRGAVLRELEQRTRYLRLTTDANGEAQAEIAPGDFDVEILAAGVTSHRTVSIPRSGPTTIDVEVVEVAGFATVRGRVVELGRPEVAIVGRPVYAWTLGSNGDRASVRATTDSNGGFELEKVLAGTVRVQAMACSTSDGSIDSTSPYRHTNRTVELTPGQELELTISVPRDEEPAATADVVTIDLSIVDASNGTGVLDANVLVLGSSGEDEYDLASLTVDREGRLRRRVPKFERYRVHVGVVRDVHGEPQRPFEAQWIDLVPVDGQVRKTVELRRTPDSK